MAGAQWGGFQWGAAEWGSPATAGGMLLAIPLPLEVDGEDAVVLVLALPLPVESDGRNPSALDVIFDIVTALGDPLVVQFDILALASALNGLRVEFDIVQAEGEALTVTFDILTDLVSRRLSDDIQGPVAEVTLS